MYKIVTISGNSSLTSRSAAILNYAQELCRKHQIEIASITVRDLPPEDLIYGNFESPEVKKLQLLVGQAEAVIISTPVYNSSYTGILKALLDLMPQYAFSGKTILPIVTGGSINHLLSIDYAIKPLFSAMGATHILKGVYVVSSQIQFNEQKKIQLDSDIDQRLKASIQELVNTLTQKQLVAV
ncbi:NADPH-dependent FMN reductase [Nostoc sp.]|uniref:NADPH-dependent FMN reductase n=1 Tax=Nostoc sp. TaxID=1180 RepID=UPI002FEEC3CC